MEDTKNKIGVILLIIFILAVAIGGYFFMNYMTKNVKDDKNEDKKEEVVELRIDKKKDYVYLDNSEELLDGVYKEDIVFNIKGLESVNNTLHNELETLSINKTTTNGITLPEGITCENELYSFSYRDYNITEFSNFVSVVISDYDYHCVNGSTPKNIKSIVINKKTGKVMSNEELLSKYEVNEDTIVKKVQERLDFTQTLDEDETQVIDINATVNDFNAGSYGTNKAISISKTGKLVINFVVKTNKINYNDSVEVN